MVLCAAPIYTAQQYPIEPTKPVVPATSSAKYGIAVAIGAVALVGIACFLNSDHPLARRFRRDAKEASREVQDNAERIYHRQQ